MADKAAYYFFIGLWGQRASAFLKAEMKKADVTYAELVKRLKKAWPQGRDRGRDHYEAETGIVYGDLFSCVRCGAGA